jgi:hypothetical protein
MFPFWIELSGMSLEQVVVGFLAGVTWLASFMVGGRN